MKVATTFSTKIQVAFVVWCMLLCRPSSSQPAATEKSPRTEIAVAVGIRCVDAQMAAIPNPVSIYITADVGKFLRVESEFTYLIVLGMLRPGIGGGAAFTVFERNEPGRVRIQLKIPVTLDLALLMGSIPVGDGFSDSVNWFLAGPETGLNLTLGRISRGAFRLSTTFGYLFRVDLGSDYYDMQDTENANNIGSLEWSFAGGVVF